MESTNRTYPAVIAHLQGQHLGQEEVLKHYRLNIPKLKPVLGRHCLLQVYEDNVRKGVFQTNFKPNGKNQHEQAGVTQQTWLRIETDFKLFQDYCELVVEPTINQHMTDYVVSTLKELLKVNSEQIDRTSYHMVETYCALLGTQQLGQHSRKALLNLHKVFNRVWMILNYQYRTESATRNFGQTWGITEVSEAILTCFQNSMGEVMDPNIFQKLYFHLEGGDIARVGVAEALSLVAPAVLGPMQCVFFALFMFASTIQQRGKIYTNAAHLALSDNTNIHERVLNISDKSEACFGRMSKEVLIPLHDVLGQILLDAIQGNWEIWSAKFTNFLGSIKKKESLACGLEILCPLVITETESEIDPEWTVVSADRGIDPQTNILSTIQSSRLDYVHSLN